jgi:hypothetical protein
MAVKRVFESACSIKKLDDGRSQKRRLFNWRLIILLHLSISTIQDNGHILYTVSLSPWTLYYYHHVHCIIFTMYILRSTRQGMYIWRIIAALLYNHCYSENPRNITYFECVSLALGIQQTISMRYIAIYGLSGPTTFFTLSHKRHDFWKKKCYRKQKEYFHFLYNVSHSTKNGAIHDQKCVLLFM